MTTDQYLARGVSATKEDVHAAILDLPKTAYPGAFCQVVEDDDGESLAVIHADGAGTKSIVAYLAFKESGHAEAFKGIAVDSAVMNIDDILCIGGCDNFLLSNTIGRNAHRIPGSVLKVVVDGYQSFADTMTKNGVRIRLCGGETADIGDLTRTIIVDSTVYCRIPRSSMIDTSRIKSNQVIVGLASFGQATYESDYNSGIGSNGLTVARHVLLKKRYAEIYPETFSETIDVSKVYNGRYDLSDRLPGSAQRIGDALLSPTRSYAPIVRQILDRYQNRISGIIHCTGGGLAKCLHFGAGIHYVKNNLFEAPPIFAAIRDAGSIDQREMWTIFNNGHRMEIYCDENIAESLIAIAGSYGVEARIIGETLASGDARNKLTIKQDSTEEVYWSKK